MFEVGDYCIGRCTFSGEILVGRLEEHYDEFDGWFTLGELGYKIEELEKLCTLDMYLLGFGDTCSK